MTELSQAILDRYQIRKTKNQKTAFIAFLQGHFPELRVEKGGLGNNRNLVLGDLHSAQVVLTAHYDTCARLPYPNFITPKNILVYLLYSLLVSLPYIFIFVMVYWLLQHLTQMFGLAYWAGFLAMMGTMFLVMMGGPANPHTANDNTSGVITLCEIYAALPAEQRSKVCFVFFDNEENGLLGSAWFAGLHKKEGLKDKLILNFDCVSDGDHFLFVLNKPARKKYGEALSDAFPAPEGKWVYMESSSKAMYPSDQSNFPMNTAVAALNKHKVVGLYMNKIHTKHDTVFDENNIRFLTEGSLRFIDGL